MSDFKIVKPHTKGVDWHEWYFPNGGRDIGPIERRDRGGKLPGSRGGFFFPEWFVLACNNTSCDARAVVPVSVLTDHANERDAEVTR